MHNDTAGNSLSYIFWKTQIYNFHLVQNIHKTSMSKNRVSEYNVEGSLRLATQTQNILCFSPENIVVFVGIN